jgi:hypothetical protein
MMLKMGNLGDKMLHNLFLVNTIAFGLGATFWSGGNWPNLLMRFTLVSLTVLNLVQYLK